MRVDVCLYALMGLANASSLLPRDSPEYSVDAGYPEEEPEYETPEYKEPQYKDPEPAYAPKADYPEKHDDYAPEPHYAPKEEYPDKPAYAPKEEYPEKPYYEPKKEYPEKPYYAPKEEYPEKPAYEPKEEYPEKPYYAPKEEYHDKPDYAPKDEYGPYYPKDEYAPKDDYAPKDAYAPKNEYASKPVSYDAGYKAPKTPWKPKTHHPEFFSLKVDQDEGCGTANVPADAECDAGGFAIRLENGIVIATKYNKWWDPKLPIFFVDDDTQAYTVSKKPLQLYVDGESGALKYAPIGWLPPNSISLSFYKTGNNPYGTIGPSPAYFSWPTTEGRAQTMGSVWEFCPLSWGQYQVFISDFNFGRSGQSGLQKAECIKQSIAAVNANPWKKSGY